MPVTDLPEMDHALLEALLSNVERVRPGQDVVALTYALCLGWEAAWKQQRPA